MKGQAQPVGALQGDHSPVQQVEKADFALSNHRMKDSDGDGKRGVGN